MRVVMCRAFGPPRSLTVEAIDDPVPGPGQVLVEIHAAGLNYTDVLSVTGRSQMNRTMPFTPGVEAAGIVIRIGAGVSRLQPGDRVLGHALSGALAEMCVYDEDDVCVIPDGMDMPTAASFYIASMTAHYALWTRTRLKEGQLLLVMGAGSGAGLAAIQIGKALGGRVIAAASTQEKLALARDAGADATVLYPAQDLDAEAIKSVAKDLLIPASRARADTIGAIAHVDLNAGYDVVYDCVGGSYAEAAFRSLGWEGSYLSVGFSAGVPRFSLGTLLFKNAQAHGIQPADPATRKPGLAVEAMERMYRRWREGVLTPLISETYELADAPEAIARLAERKASGRIVIIPKRT